MVDVLVPLDREEVSIPISCSSASAVCNVTPEYEAPTCDSIHPAASSNDKSGFALRKAENPCSIAGSCGVVLLDQISKKAVEFNVTVLLSCVVPSNSTVPLVVEVPVVAVVSAVTVVTVVVVSEGAVSVAVAALLTTSAPPVVAPPSVVSEVVVSDPAVDPVVVVSYPDVFVVVSVVVVLDEVVSVVVLLELVSVHPVSLAVGGRSYPSSIIRHSSAAAWNPSA